MMFSKLANRIREIAAVADVRPRPKPDTIKRMNENLNKALEGAPVYPAPEKAKADLAKPPLEKPAQISNSLPPVTHRRTGKAGIDLMHSFEGCARKLPDGRYAAYPDPGSKDGHPWTIGWGSTGPDPFNGGQIRKGTVWTQEQCDMHFANSLGKYEAGVRDALGKAPTSQLQFDAMVCLCYNIGIGAFQRSSVARKHKAGDFGGAAKAFLMWVKNDGKVMRGLVRRREAEAALYRSGF
jgi:GH24 family phage-related lysozyme (muramidase)